MTTFTANGQVPNAALWGPVPIRGMKSMKVLQAQLSISVPLVYNTPDTKCHVIPYEKLIERN